MRTDLINKGSDICSTCVLSWFLLVPVGTNFWYSCHLKKSLLKCMRFLRGISVFYNLNTELTAAAAGLARYNYRAAGDKSVSSDISLSLLGLEFDRSGLLPTGLCKSASYCTIFLKVYLLDKFWSLGMLLYIYVLTKLTDLM